MPGEMPEPASEGEFHQDVNADADDPELAASIERAEAALTHFRDSSPPIVDLRPTDDGDDPILDFARRTLGYKGKEK